MDFAQISNFFQELSVESLTYVVSPEKRTYWVYILSTFVIALFVYLSQKKRGRFVDYFLSRKIWLGRSAFIDYALILFNSLVKVLVLAPILIYALHIAEGLGEYLTQFFGHSELGWSPTTIVILYTVAIVVVNDFASYVIHYMMHKIPFLWEFHKIHHSATHLTPFTQYRLHPIELIINNIRGIAIKGFITGFFLYLGNGNVSLLTFFGINALNFLFFFLGANLRHSHVRFRYFDFLENILISPYQHQIHHSNRQEHYDTNLGSRLAIWDYLFGTLIKSKEAPKVSFGLGEEDKSYDTFTKNLFNPFVNLVSRKRKNTT